MIPTQDRQGGDTEASEAEIENPISTIMEQITGLNQKIEHNVLEIGDNAVGVRINEVIASIKEIDENVGRAHNTIDGMNTSMEEIENRLADLEKENTELKKTNKSLMIKLENIEGQCRRNSLIFYGFNDNENEKWDGRNEKRIRSYSCVKDNWNKLGKAHRIKSVSRLRPIFFKVEKFKQKDVLAKTKQTVKKVEDQEEKKEAEGHNKIGTINTWTINCQYSWKNKCRTMPRRTVIEAKVVDAEKRRVPSKHYVYVIHVTWSDGSVNVIYRRYSAFFDFQVKLLMKYPDEAGTKNPQQRSIPFIPGKKLLGRSHTREVAAKRQKPLNDYCKSLVRLPINISESKEVIDFFTPTPEDINPPTEKDSAGKDKSDIEEITGPIQSETYVVIADYKKQAKNEVTLKEGEQVEVLEKGDNGWWFISVHDAQGWAPGTFMQRDDGKDDEDFIVGNYEKYISNCAYEAQQEDELSFEIGAVVEIVKKSLDGWWLVKYLNEQGWVPAAYLQVYKGPDRSNVKPSGPTQIIGSIKDIGKKSSSTPDSTDASNMFLKGPQSSSGLRLDNKSKPTPPRRSTVRRSLKNRRSTGAIRRVNRVPMDYYTIEDYANHVGDGISFKKGLLVEVIEKSSSGWWLVKINNEEGWVPATFIEKRPVTQMPSNADDTPSNNNNTVKVTDNTPKMGGHAFQPYNKQVIHPVPVKPLIPDRPKQLGGSGSPRQVGGGRSPRQQADRKSPRDLGGGESNGTVQTNELSTARAKLKSAGKPVIKKQNNMDSGDELSEEVKRVFARKSSNLYITTCQFEKEDVEGIGFAEGVEVEVLEEHASGWWLVRIGDEEGWAPSSFLQKL
ncbi:SH3 and PX domain-containing protein 2A-like isoform X2 [Anneissia japonica]|uniref:SH3 and PX domain-containing protein 2A-like isoform X2 n=1 Tax=Anneissia japonica TaxID=1529436 RepID=UPI001425AA4C|nr:SH3 and PX domain-containing protein 2A-like isoform X2 [Anneissia japonica]